MGKLKSISLIPIMIILALVISYHIYYHFMDNVAEKEVENFLAKKDIKEISTNNVEKINTIKEKIQGVLEIPKIKLKKEFYDINSNENNVNKNIMILKESKMPNINNSILFIAAHSGNANISFFKNLDLLELDDNIIIHYQNKKYYYTVSKIYELKKDGTLTVNKNIHENMLVLTTCSKNKDKQLIVVSKLFQTI